MDYTIWIVDSPWDEFKHNRCFDDVALALQAAFKELGYTVPITRAAKDVVGTAIVLAPNTLAEFPNRLPGKMILFNMEQIHDDSEWLKPNYNYIEWLKAYPVWDYSARNVQALKERGVENIILCEIGYAPSLESVEPAEDEDIDVLFIGTMSERRKLLVERMQASGLSVHVETRIFGSERNALIARAKIILNMHQYGAEIFNVVRVSFALANKKCVISELGRDVDMEAPYKDAVVFAEYDKLVETCREYLQNDTKRKAQANHGYEIFKSIPQAPRLKTALDKHESMQQARMCNVHEHERIFVLIASYRDPECQHTIKNLFEKARYPERVFVGVCWQFDDEKDQHCFNVPYPRPDQVRVINYHFRDAKGANWARAEAWKLWNGEEYVLSIDSHTRFVDAWDDVFIHTHRRSASGTEKSALTIFPNVYHPGHEPRSYNGWIPLVKVAALGHVGTPQLVHLGCHYKHRHDLQHWLPRTPFVVACCIFAPAKMFQEVPIDPHIHFYGDEITLSARLWTHGWNLYQPVMPVIWTYWPPGYTDGKAYKVHDSKANKVSWQRVMHVLQLKDVKNPDAKIDADQYGLGEARSMKDFWHITGVDVLKRKLPPFAQRGDWRFEEVEQQESTMETAQTPSIPRIFVMIASYRDPECQYTVKDLFEKAKHPERVSVGICWQFDPDEDKHCFEVPYPRPDQVRVLEVNYKDAKGVCWARAETQKLWAGEEYVLQIDSHMRFVDGWDEKMLEELKACNSTKPVLSCCIAKYTPPNELEQNPKPSILRSGFFSSEGNIRNRGAYLTKSPPKPLNSAFISGGFLFASSEMIREVPYDPIMYFDQEEITYAVRLYTHGWDVFSSREPFVYHHYIKLDTVTRPLHWKDLKQENKQDDYTYLRMRGLKRMNHLTQHTASDDPDVIQDIGHYGLGKVRTLEDFERYAGLNFRTKKVSNRAVRAEFIEDLSKYVRGIYVPELDDKDVKPPLSYEKDSGKLFGAPKSPVTAPQIIDRAAAEKHAHERIFVFIPSYRDPECQYTVKNLFDRAKYPERIFVGINWQADSEADKDCFNVPYPYPQQVRTVNYHPSQAQGLGWARAEALKLWRGEEYILQIDAHMRFAQDWDVALIDMLTRCPSPKPVISAMLPNYTPPDELYLPHTDKVTHIRIKNLALESEPGIVHVAGEFVPKTDPRSQLYPTPIVVGNFVFARNMAFSEVPIDPYIQFNGEEIAYSARLWTHGYDIFQPDALIAWHKWVNKETLKKQEYKNRTSSAAQRTRARIRHLLAIELSDNAHVTAELDRYGHGTVRTLESYFEYLGVDPEKWTLSKNAENGLWHLPTNSSVSAVIEQQGGFLSYDSGKKSAVQESVMQKAVQKDGYIFVQIASYRDPQCRFTIEDLYAKATHPERINIGVCLQILPKRDLDCALSGEGWPGDVRIMQINARESKGACWARRETQKLWKGEEFTLQVDSHMRFEQGWDEKIIQIQLESERMSTTGKAVLSTYPPGFTPPDKLEKDFIYSISAKEFMPQGILLMKGKGHPAKNPPEAPMRGAFAGACFLFGRSSIIDDVPYDPYLYFFGEEITLTVRLWTYGYDIFHPNAPIAYHDWNRGKRKATHFSDHHDWEAANRRSFQRVRHLLGMQRSEKPEVTENIEKYGLGTARTLKEYEDYAGIDFARRMIGANAYDAEFPSKFAAQAQKPNGRHAEASISAQPIIAKNAVKPSPEMFKSGQSLTRLGRTNHQGPIKTYESPEAIVYDNFLPEEVYERVYNFSVQTDYQHINTTGKISRVWNLDNGFPLRSQLNEFYHTRKRFEQKPDHVYPTGKAYDLFVDNINGIMPEVEHLVGKPATEWEHFSVTGWIYPPNTGLSLHDDGSGVYTGAYVYFLNPYWRPHWGGLLLLMDRAANQAVREFKDSDINQMSFYKKKWLHESEHDDIISEVGFAQCIMPKRNRVVFIAPDAFHMVTKVHPTAGDNVRMSLAGFFNRGNVKNTEGY